MSEARWIDVDALLGGYGAYTEEWFIKRLKDGDFDAPAPAAAGLDRGKVWARLAELVEWSNNRPRDAYEEGFRGALAVFSEWLTRGCADLAPAPAPAPAAEGEACGCEPGAPLDSTMVLESLRSLKANAGVGSKTDNDLGRMIYQIQHTQSYDLVPWPPAVWDDPQPPPPAADAPAEGREGDEPLYLNDQPLSPAMAAEVVRQVFEGAMAGGADGGRITIGGYLFTFEKGGPA